MSPERFLEKLKSMQSEYSQLALTKPEAKDAFGYGKACGIYQGLLLAEQLFFEETEESDGS